MRDTPGKRIRGRLAAWSLVARQPGHLVGLRFLVQGRLLSAAGAAEFAAVLATCAVGSAGCSPAYYVWLTSMVLVAYAASRAPRSAGELDASPSTGPPRLMSAKPRPIFYRAVALPVVVGVVLVLLAHWDIYKPQPDLSAWEFEPNKNVRTGEDARAEILSWAGKGMGVGKDGATLPTSASDFWLYHDGGFSGSISYCTFRCGNRAECVEAVEYLAGVAPRTSSGGSLAYAVVMAGRRFIRGRSVRKKNSAYPWDVRDEDGCSTNTCEATTIQWSAARSTSTATEFISLICPAGFPAMSIGPPAMADENGEAHRPLIVSDAARPLTNQEKRRYRRRTNQ